VKSRHSDPQFPEKKPRVLIADDHLQVLDAVSNLLAGSFDVVGAVTDGRRALDEALRMDPDVVVLDISMPELDGFQTLEEMRRFGLRAKVVFLSMHEGEEYVEAAVHAGARGFVPKSRLPEITNALQHVLAGRLFLPSLSPLTAIPGVRHAMQLYTDEGLRLDDLGAFTGTALRKGEVVAVAGTDATRDGLAWRLSECGFNVAALTDQGRYLPLNAEDLLAQIMSDGRPDESRLAELGERLERARLAAATAPETRISIFGEMVALLFQNGNPEAAIDLERIWHGFLSTGQVSRHIFTLCGYHSACFEDNAHPVLFSNVCAQHDSVIHSRHSI